MCTRICLCVLCGLPAAGKSTLAQAVNSHSVQRGWRSAVISYDDLIPGDAFNVKEVEDEEDIPRSQTQTEWKCHRQAVLRCVEQFLQSPTEQLPPIIYQINSDARSRLLHAAQVCGTPVGSSQVCGTPAGSSQVCGTPVGSSQAYPSPSDRPPPPLVILLDDNFYYPSMRYEVYQLARKHSVGFCQVYVHCPVESCVRRNQLRPQPLPSDVIVEMAKRMEPPNPQRNSWEQNSVTLDSEHHFTIEYIQRLVKVISTALENPLSPVQDNAEQKVCSVSSWNPLSPVQDNTEQKVCSVSSWNPLSPVQDNAEQKVCSVSSWNPLSPVQDNAEQKACSVSSWNPLSPVQDNAEQKACSVSSWNPLSPVQDNAEQKACSVSSWNPLSPVQDNAEQKVCSVSSWNPLSPVQDNAEQKVCSVSSWNPLTLPKDISETLQYSSRRQSSLQYSDEHFDHVNVTSAVFYIL
uniref:Phosphoseryl-tRNA kinase n=1 Tax=Oncorhynchus mykiss TaxID=8022 RepID=A0A8K9VBJ1_ONCMY